MLLYRPIVVHVRETEGQNLELVRRELVGSFENVVVGRTDRALVGALRDQVELATSEKKAEKSQSARVMKRGKGAREETCLLVLKIVLSTTEPIGAFWNSLQREFLRKKRELLRFLTTMSENFGLREKVKSKSLN